jgi:hypothetical protein
LDIIVIFRDFILLIILGYVWELDFGGEGRGIRRGLGRC